MNDDQTPRRPWVISNQYGFKMVISQDNEIILSNKMCEAIPDRILKLILDTVNESRNMTIEERNSLDKFCESEFTEEDKEPKGLREKVEKLETRLDKLMAVLKVNV